MTYETPVLSHPTRQYEIPMLVDLAEVAAYHEDGYAEVAPGGCDGLCLTGGGTGSIEGRESLA